jgi:hypothetical protein
MTKVFSLNNTIINYNNCSFKSVTKTTVIGVIFVLISSSAVQAEEIAFSNKTAEGISPVVSTSTPYTSSFSSVVFNDENGNGRRDSNENGISGVYVKIFDEKGLEINVGPDGILDNEDDSSGGVVTNEEGVYRFQNISQNFYRIKIL